MIAGEESVNLAPRPVELLQREDVYEPAPYLAGDAVVVHQGSLGVCRGQEEGATERVRAWDMCW